MTFMNSLSEELAHAYVASRLDEALTRRTSIRAGRPARGRRRSAAVDHYTHYLTARGEALS